MVETFTRLEKLRGPSLLSRHGFMGQEAPGCHLAAERVTCCCLTTKSVCINFQAVAQGSLLISAKFPVRTESKDQKGKTSAVVSDTGMLVAN